MTKYYLLPYTCSRCHKLRRTFYEIQDDSDKQIINAYYESDDMMLTLNDLTDIELLCPKCRQHGDLLAYG